MHPGQGRRHVAIEQEIAFSPPLAQLTAQGTLDLAEWRAALRALVADPGLPPEAPILCDLRAITLPGSVNPETVFRELRLLLPHRPVAFVVKPGALFRAAHEIFTATRREIQVFTDYKAALLWLMSRGEPDA